MSQINLTISTKCYKDQNNFEHDQYTSYSSRKIIPITGRARSFLLFLDFQKNREEGVTEQKLDAR